MDIFGAVETGFKVLWQRLFGPKCQICHKRAQIAPVKCVPHPAGYYGQRYHYHEACLRNVIANPERFGHRTVDLALDILSAKEKQAREEIMLEGRRRERVAAARERLGL